MAPAGSVSEVDDVLVKSNRIARGKFGLRLKSSSKGKGYVNNVRFINNELIGLWQVGIEVVQNYKNGVGFSQAQAGAGCPFQNIEFSGNTVSVTERAAKFSVACAPGACTRFSWDGSLDGGGKEDMCQNAPRGLPCGDKSSGGGSGGKEDS